MAYDITNIAIEDYLTSLMPPRPEVLADLEQRAHLRGLPLIGPVEGQFLYLLAKSINAREVLEIGTATGYAALWLLRAVAPAGGHLTAIERQSERYQLAHEYATRAGYAECLRIREGDWFVELDHEHGPYDMIFLDILRFFPDDQKAIQSLEKCLPLLRPGGILIADNVLCNALVLEEDAAPTVRGIQQFNLAIMSHPELESVIVPLRDGVAICRKRTPEDHQELN